MHGIVKRASLKPSLLMGEGRVGVNVCARVGLTGSPHPKPLPIKGRGFCVTLGRAS